VSLFATTKALAALAFALDRLLHFILELIETHGRAARQQQRQADHDAISDDPGAWADAHFNGLRPPKLPDDAIAAPAPDDPGRV
jgi:hypothetical protein